MIVFSGIIPTSNILSHYLHFSLWFENMRLYPKISTILFSLLLPPKLFSNIAKPNDWFLFFWVSAPLHSLVHPIHDIYTSNLGLHTKLKYLPVYFGISRCVWFISNVSLTVCSSVKNRYCGQKFSEMLHTIFYSSSSTMNISELCTPWFLW